ncbi:MAG: hypothetical protein JWL75_358 [Parcubacteria group bacterium]|nr:hypothetical protein [Parcubacteria group bacterium]
MPSEQVHQPETTEVAEAQPQSAQEKKPDSFAEEARVKFDKLHSSEDMTHEDRAGSYRNLGKQVDAERAGLREKIRAEGGQLDEARARLGLSASNEGESHASRAMQAELQELDTLYDDMDSAFRENQKGIESQERGTQLRKGAEAISDAGFAFGNELGRRDADGMDPLMDRDTFSKFRAGIRGLRSFAESKGEPDMEALGMALSQVNTGLERMEKQNTRGQIRESEESLGRLGFQAVEMSDYASKMRNSFREGDESASAAAHRLSDTSDRVSVFTGRLRSAFRDYSR